MLVSILQNGIIYGSMNHLLFFSVRKTMWYRYIFYITQSAIMNETFVFITQSARNPEISWHVITTCIMSLYISESNVILD